MVEAAANIAEYTVSEISAAVKHTVEDAFGYVRVRGEISGFRGVHGSGHGYFTLKDEKARLEAVVWRSTFARLKFKPEEGVEVVATGRLTTFAGQSKYQIVIDALEPAGVGALMALLDKRRKALAAEGLFAEGRKVPLPYLPRVIGVVTSPTGAVIRDILHRLADRFPTRVIVWPVRVQGETSAAEVAAAIDGFNRLNPGGALPRPDLIIVARGGGSLEDLWSFNEEIVVRAAANSAIPLICGGRPRDRLDADRPRRRPAGADADGGGGDGGAGALRTRRQRRSARRAAGGGDAEADRGGAAGAAWSGSRHATGGRPLRHAAAGVRRPRQPSRPGAARQRARPSHPVRTRRRRGCRSPGSTG